MVVACDVVPKRAITLATGLRRARCRRRIEHMFEKRNAQRVAPGVFSRDVEIRTCALLDQLEASPPGPGLIEALDAFPIDDLTPLSQVRVLALWDRAEAWIGARKQPAIVAVAGLTPREKDDWAREEVAACLRLSPDTARGRIRVARALCGRLADTHAALAAGDMSLWQVLHLAEAVQDLSDTAAAEVQTRVLPRAGQQTLTQFRQSVARAVHRADPRDAQEKHLDARDGREVVLVANDRGMATLIAHQPAEDAALVHLACDTLARELREPDDARTLAQRGSDALTELARRYLAGTLSTAHGQPVTLNVTVDTATLFGFADNPAHLAGYGPITPDIARALAKDALWRWVLTDPSTGVVLDSGPRHDPGQHLRDLVLLRHPTCTAPGCARPSRNCDLDHTIPYPQGPTCECNLAPLCRRHHRLKTTGRWTLQHLPDHTMRWTTQAGLTYTVPPPAIGPPHPDRDPDGDFFPDPSCVPDPDYQPPPLVRPCAHPRITPHRPGGQTRAETSTSTTRDEELEPPF